MLFKVEEELKWNKISSTRQRIWLKSQFFMESSSPISTNEAHSTDEKAKETRTISQQLRFKSQHRSATINFAFPICIYTVQRCILEYAQKNCWDHPCYGPFSTNESQMDDSIFTIVRSHFCSKFLNFVFCAYLHLCKYISRSYVFSQILLHILFCNHKNYKIIT